jgi:hypothetical protein
MQDAQAYSPGIGTRSHRLEETNAVLRGAIVVDFEESSVHVGSLRKAIHISERPQLGA